MAVGDLQGVEEWEVAGGRRGEGAEAVGEDGTSVSGGRRRVMEEAGERLTSKGA